MASDESKAIAEVYAEALFELAAEGEQAEIVGNELNLLGQLQRDYVEWEMFLESPSISHDHKSELITKVFTEKLSDLTFDFLQVLARKNRLGLLSEIQKQFVSLYDEQLGRVRGELTTAIELSQDERQSLTEKINQTLNKTVRLDWRVDAEIIGGMTLALEDKLFDGSVRNRLARFSRQVKLKMREQQTIGEKHEI